MVYEFTKDLETGNAIIDSEHKQLLSVVNKLMDECGKGHGRAALEPTLKFLLDYVDKHFAHEDQLQRQNGYPNKDNHYKFHESYKAKLREIASKIPAEGPSVGDMAAINMQIGVLVSHIRTEDKKLGAFLKDSK